MSANANGDTKEARSMATERSGNVARCIIFFSIISQTPNCLSAACPVLEMARGSDICMRTRTRMFSR